MTKRRCGSSPDTGVFIQPSWANADTCPAPSAVPTREGVCIGSGRTANRTYPDTSVRVKGDTGHKRVTITGLAVLFVAICGCLAGQATAATPLQVKAYGTGPGFLRVTFIAPATTNRYLVKWLGVGCGGKLAPGRAARAGQRVTLNVFIRDGFCQGTFRVRVLLAGKLVGQATVTR